MNDISFTKYINRDKHSRLQAVLNEPIRWLGLVCDTTLTSYSVLCVRLAMMRSSSLFVLVIFCHSSTPFSLYWTRYSDTLAVVFHLNVIVFDVCATSNRGMIAGRRHLYKL